MKLRVLRLVLGPLQNNVYVLADEDSRDAVIIDPSFEPAAQSEALLQGGWNLRQVWLTHGHYDHTAGLAALLESFHPQPLVGMHTDAFAWAAEQSNRVFFGTPIDPVTHVDIAFFQDQMLGLDPQGGEKVVEVREVPGHSPGSVIFYCAQLGLAFTGDAVFRESIGRTDLPGGDYLLLISKIREQILTLPDETKLLPGHGPESSVAHEKKFNPYLA